VSRQRHRFAVRAMEEELIVRAGSQKASQPH